MKTSAATAGIIILAAAAFTGRYLDGRLEGETQARSRKLTEVAKFETPDRKAPQNSAVALPAATGGLPPGEVETTKKLAAELFTFAKEMVAAKREGASEALQPKMVSVMCRILALGPPQLKIVIGEILTSSELDELLREDMLETMFTQLGKKTPEEALALLMRTREKFTNEVRQRRFVFATLESWSRKNPLAAMEWARSNSSILPGIINDDAKRRITSSAAVSDPRRAFRFVNELKIEDGAKAAAEILESAAANPDPKVRTTTLQAFRAYLAGNQDSSDLDRTLAEAMPKLAAAVAKEGFASCTAWIADSKLDEKELASFISGIPLGGEEGSWIEWIGHNLPPDKFENIVRERITKWAAGDHKAVGNWLNATPDSLVRQAAVSAFAETVARYEPESAEQWAMTLPAGALRDGTLQRIRSDWPATAPEAARPKSDFP